MSKRRYLLELDEAISAMERGELFWEDMPGLRERFRSVLESGTGDTRGAGSTDAAAPSSPASPVTARHDKATGGRTEAAAVDQAIADVEYAEGVLSRDPFDDTQRAHAAEMLRAALRVLADAVEEGRGDYEKQREYADEQYRKALAAEAERNKLRSCLEVIADMGDYVYKPHEFASIARSALAAARSRDPQEGA